jgi:hypothetical protein
VEFLEADHPEWMQMWEELSEYALNEGDAICLFLGRCWEYMGSSDSHHHFRHNLHPRTGKAEYAYVERRRAGVNWDNAGWAKTA